jgi:hypothetical protein
VVEDEHAGGLGEGQQLGALAAQQLGDGSRVAQGDAEQGVADGVVGEATSSQVGQRLGVSLVEQERVGPERDRGVDLPVAGDVGRVSLGDGAGLPAARRGQARADLLAEELAQRAPGIAGPAPVALVTGLHPDVEAVAALVPAAEGAGADVLQRALIDQAQRRQRWVDRRHGLIGVHRLCSRPARPVLGNTNPTHQPEALTWRAEAGIVGADAGDGNNKASPSGPVSLGSLRPRCWAGGSEALSLTHMVCIGRVLLAEHLRRQDSVVRVYEG